MTHFLAHFLRALPYMLEDPVGMGTMAISRMVNRAVNKVMERLKTGETPQTIVRALTRITSIRILRPLKLVIRTVIRNKSTIWEIRI